MILMTIMMMTMMTMMMMLTSGGKLPTNDAHPRQFWLIALPPCPMFSPLPNKYHQIFSRILFHNATLLLNKYHDIYKGERQKFYE